MANITIRVGELAKPISAIQVKRGTELEQFLERRGIRYGSSVRVNGIIVSRNYVFKTNDIVTLIGDVSGGI